MDRSLWPQGVEVDVTDLKNATDQMIFHLLERFTALGVMGIRSGLTLSVNGTDPSRFDLDAGDCFAAGGELVEVEAANVGMVLADTASGARNYVVAFYTEVGARPGRPEAGGAARDRAAVRSSRVEILSEAAFSALLPASTNVLIRSRERAAVVGVVVAPSVVGGALTTASFTQSTAYERILTVGPFVNLTGIVISRIDPAMPVSEGQTTNAAARFEMDFNTPVYRMRMRAPGSSTFGDWVTITAGGSFTIYSDPGSVGPYVTVTVSVAFLPLVATATTLNDELAISALYEAPYGAARLSANDASHRSALGSGVATARNPHGLTFADLAGEPAVRTLIVGRGLANSATQNVIPRIVYEGGSAGAYVLEDESRLSGTNVRRRVYRDTTSGAKLETVNAYWSPASANWNKDVAGQNASRVSQQVGSLVVQGRVSDAAWTTWDDYVGIGQFGSTITQLLVQASVAQLSTTTARHQATFPVSGAGNRVLIWESLPTDGALTGAVYRIYRTCVASGAGNDAGATEYTFNARWNGSNWERDDSSPSYKYEYGRVLLLTILRRSTNATPWADNAWETTPFSLSAGGALTLASTLTAGAVVSTTTIVGASVNATVSASAPFFTLSAASAAVPTANTIYRGSIALFHLAIQISSAGALTTLGGFNISSSPAPARTGDRVRVDFATALPTGYTLVRNAEDVTNVYPVQVRMFTRGTAFIEFELTSVYNAASLSLTGGVITYVADFTAYAP